MKTYYLSPSWRVYYSDGKTFIRSDLECFCIAANEEDVTVNNNNEVIIRNITENANSLVEFLIKKRIILHEKYDFLSNSLQSAYFFHKGYGDSSLEPSAARDELGNKSVIILGLGAVGAAILDQLVSSGIKKFILIDFDRVEETNLERQLIYKIGDVGKYKVDLAKAHVHSKRKNAEVIVYKEMITSEDQLKNILKKFRIDFGCICIDEPPQIAFTITSQALWEERIPFIHGGVMIDSGFWGPIFCQKNDSVSPKNHSVWGNRANQGVLGPIKVCFSPYNSIVSNFMAACILHYLCGLTDLVDFNNRHFINFSELKIERIAPINASENG